MSSPATITVLAAGPPPANLYEWLAFLLPYFAILLGTMTSLFAWLNNRSGAKREKPLKDALKSSLDNSHTQIMGQQTEFREVRWKMENLAQQLQALVDVLHSRTPR